MTVKVAINGFGRIGRLALRRIQNVEGIEVVAINDLTPVNQLVHLLKYDTTQGRFDGEVSATEESLVVNGKEIKAFANPNPTELPWGELGIDVVLECTGFFTSKEKADAVYSYLNTRPANATLIIDEAICKKIIKKVNKNF